MEEKFYCTTCHQYKGANEFYIRKRLKVRGGRSTCCKTCENESLRLRRLAAKGVGEIDETLREVFMSREEIAKALGISRKTVTSIEKSAINKIKANLLRMNISIRDLITE